MNCLYKIYTNNSILYNTQTHIISINCTIYKNVFQNIKQQNFYTIKYITNNLHKLYTIINVFLFLELFK